MDEQDGRWKRPQDRDAERSEVAEQLADMAVEALREPLARSIDRVVKLGGDLKGRLMDVLVGRDT
jgi:hypothetical protein